MCSLVNAKSGGCAEDCGFCAQSRYAEAETPMHAMMEPEQILEQPAPRRRRARTASAWSPRARAVEARLREGPGRRPARCRAHEPQAVRVDRPHVHHGRDALKEAGIQRVHHNVETAESYYPEVSTTVRYQGRLRTIDAVREAGLETCVGGILNLGETPEQRVEMALSSPHRSDQGSDQPAQPPAGHEVRRPRADGSVGGRQVDRDLPPDPPGRAVPAVRRPRREPRRAPADRRQGRAQRRDDGQLPDHAREHPRERTAEMFEELG